MFDFCLPDSPKLFRFLREKFKNHRFALKQVLTHRLSRLFAALHLKKPDEVSRKSTAFVRHFV